VLGCCAAGVMMDPCSGRSNSQEQCVIGGWLLVYGCLGSRSAKDAQSDLVELQVSESVLGSWLSRVAQRSSKARGE